MAPRPLPTGTPDAAGPDREPHVRDMIVVGASSGGLAALETLVRDLPADLPAALAIVWHSNQGERGFLARFLERVGKLPARLAEQGDPVRSGEIVVAPPDHHLLVEPGGYRLSHGPRENRCRPAVDVLFRSAAVHFRSRVIGVVLTGQLYDGSAGLEAIQLCGGMTFVQDPEEAAYPGMPESALARLTVDQAASLPRLAELLVEHAGTPAPQPPPVPDRLVRENRLATGCTGIELEESLGELVPFGCPECGGPLWEMEGDVQRFRCHVGHAFSTAALLAEQRAATEQALWAATRVMEERERVLRSLQTKVGGGESMMSGDLERRALEVTRHKQVLIDLLGRMGQTDELAELVSGDARTGNQNGGNGAAVTTGGGPALAGLADEAAAGPHSVPATLKART